MDQRVKEKFQISEGDFEVQTLSSKTEQRLKNIQRFEKNSQGNRRSDRRAPLGNQT
jgi:hypothetical protein